jgi:hypothetical protein
VAPSVSFWGPRLPQGTAGPRRYRGEYGRQRPPDQPGERGTRLEDRLDGLPGGEVAIVLARLALFGAAVLLAVAAYAVRPHAPASSPEPPFGVQLSGRTEQSMPMYVVARHGLVRRIRLVWRLNCTDGASRPLGATFVDVVDRFERRGRAFSVRAEWSKPGWRARAAARGALTPDGRSASGSGWSDLVQLKHGHVQKTCGSGLVTWRARPVTGQP